MGLISLGPLTLECICDGGAGVPCSLTALDLVVTDWFAVSFGDVELHVTAGGDTKGATGDGAIGLDPSIWLPNLASATVQYQAGRSTSGDFFSTAGAKYAIRATFTCVAPGGGGTSTRYVYSYFKGSNQAICTGNGQAAILGPSVAAQWWHSTPLSDCTEIYITATGGFSPIEANKVQGGTSGTSKWCLCASGGTGYYDPDTGDTLGAVYKFSILSGTLPSGQHLDEDTGCIEGVPDGADPGTSEVTFRVIDVRSTDAAYADVTCGVILPGCTGSTPTPAGNWFL